MKNKDADSLFKSEITPAQVQGAAHFTYRDGFRLGLGIFVGLMIGSTVLLVLVWLFTKIF